MVQIRVSPEIFFDSPPVLGKNVFGSGGIRTHAPEETGALNQRLRPLGHATLHTFKVSESKKNTLCIFFNTLLTVCIRKKGGSKVNSMGRNKVLRRNTEGISLGLSLIAEDGWGLFDPEPEIKAHNEKMKAGPNI